MLFLLETQLLHLRAGNWHRLNFTAAELEKVLENLRFESLARGVEASALASEWKAPDRLTLPALISIAPPGMWPELLEDHRRGMTALLGEIDHAVAANVSLLQGPLGSGTVSQSPQLDAGPDLAGSDGFGGSDDLALLARDANVHRAIAAVQGATLPTLRDFLGLG
ncbi:hypothetical protein FQP90_18675 [Paenarthrobacter nitroguajacolicus]|uniref:Flagellar protein FlgN n=1 Tax=Paenarthrobacter nitroguajacolicus TaxID=211146 RepID=A0A558GS72_PAENT|nr:hypothetical protein [Paenarthrobacter nitroguajacolicus]TVU59724.1 hypothetical protein FQP90_18675 [Paenarthrobacter nitroguajacolicus]